MIRFYAISLLILFVLNVLGGISFLLIQQYHRHEYVESMIKSGSFDHPLTQIHLSADELEEIIWVKPNFEFRYKGNMFDVIRRELTSDGGTIFHCIADHEETKLYAKIEKTLGKIPVGQHNDQMIMLELFKFFSGFFMPIFTETENNICSALKCNSLYTLYSIEVNLPLPTEPPDWS